MRERLRRKIAGSKPILAVAAGIPLTAKAAHDSGADFIITHKEAVFGADGRLPVIARTGYGGNGNDIMMRMAEKFAAAAKGTPVIAGVGPAEPYMNVDRYTDRLLNQGIAGVTNYPTAGGWVGSYGNGIRIAGVGYSLEVEYIKRWSMRGVLTVGYCFTPEQVKQMIEADAAILSLYVPRTEKESHGWDDAPCVESAVETALKLFETAREEDKDRILLFSGATISNITDISYYLKTTKAHGYISDELVECSIIEQGVVNAVSGYRRLKVHV